MNRIKESFFNLILIASGIKQYWISKNAIESVINSIDVEELELPLPPGGGFEKSLETQSFAIKGFIIIQTCAFLDEYTRIFKLTVEDTSLEQQAIKFRRELKSIMKPAIAFINDSWKDLYEARNTLLAHGWRQGTGGEAIMFTERVQRPSNVPWINEEFTLLISIFISVLEILAEYKPEYFEELKLRTAAIPRVNHMTRSSSHEQSLQLSSAVKVLMKTELDIIKQSN